MKKINIIFFTINVILFLSVSVFAYSYLAQEVGYSPTDTEWNVDNTKDAIDDLRDVAKVCDFSCRYIPGDVVYESGYLGFGDLFEPPCDGDYRIELWGASGGDGVDLSNDSLNGYAKGGKGGYTKGDISLNPTIKLYVFVGGKGVQRYSAGVGTATGGYNGGADGYLRESAGYYRQISSGGGATDIRYFGTTPTSGQLAWNSDIGLNSRIMVAGGGGGIHQNYATASNYSIIDGGSAGGLTAYAAYVASTGGFSTVTPTGGTQISGGQSSGGTSVHDWQSTSLTNTYPGTFGKGGTITNPSRSDISQGGGGGGYYGGGAGVWKAAGGGSSYISGHSGCVAIKSGSTSEPREVKISSCSSNPTASDECSIHYSGLYFTNTKMVDGKGYEWTSTKASTVTGMPSHSSLSSMTGNTGDGYVRITYLGRQ